MAWKIETIDADVGDTGQIAVDGSGNPHVVYTHGWGGPNYYGLNYGYRDGTGWHTEVLTASGIYQAIAARGDHIAVAWSVYSDDYCNVDIYCATKVIGGSWSIDLVQTPAPYQPDCYDAWGITGIAIALDSAFAPHIVYARNWQWYDGGYNNYSTMVYLDGSSGWSETLFNTNENIGTDYGTHTWMASNAHCLAIDSSDTLHVTWDEDVTIGSDWMSYIYYANSADGWTPVEVASIAADGSGHRYGQWPTLAINDDGGVAILYNYNGATTINYYHPIGGTSEEISGNLAGRFANALSNTEALVVRWESTALKISTLKGGSWTTVDVAGAGSHPANPDIVYDAVRKKYHIIYCALWDGDTKYAVMGGAQAQWMFF